MLAQVLGAKVGISVEPPEHVGHALGELVMQRIDEARPLRAVERHGGMDALVAPGLRALAIEPRGQAGAERAAPAVPDQAVAHIVVDGNLAVGPAVVGQGGAELLRQAGADDLVGVDFQDPVAAGGLHPGGPPRPLKREDTADRHRAIGLADRPAVVGATVQHQDDLVGEVQGLKTAGQAPFFIVDAEHSRQLGHDFFPHRWKDVAGRMSPQQKSSAVAHCRDPIYVISIMTCGHFRRPSPRLQIDMVLNRFRSASGGLARRTCASARVGPFAASGSMKRLEKPAN